MIALMKKPYFLSFSRLVPTLPIFALIGISLALSGCGTFGEREKYPGLGVVGGEREGNKWSTYVQWDENYAITTAHTGPLARTVYRSKELDLQFVYRPLQSYTKNGKTYPDVVPRWRSAQPPEPLVLKGYPETHSTRVQLTPSQAVAQSFMYNEQNVYQLAKGRVVHGMSGGAVSTPSGENVGMVIGNLRDAQTFESTQPQYYVIYLPYTAIEAEFEKFLKQKKK